MEKLKFPIGDFQMIENAGLADFQTAIKSIAEFPDLLKKECRDLTNSELQWRYRPDGWRIYEVIHHCADSHMNAYIRFKKALSDPSSSISGYQEDSWARMKDTQELPISNALDLLRPLHIRWAHLLKGLDREFFKNGYYHPDSQRVVLLSEAVLLYQWHCNHHLAHVQNAKKYKF